MRICLKYLQYDKFLVYSTIHVVIAILQAHIGPPQSTASQKVGAKQIAIKISNVFP